MKKGFTAVVIVFFGGYSISASAQEAYGGRFQNVTSAIKAFGVSKSCAQAGFVFNKAQLAAMRPVLDEIVVRTIGAVSESDLDREIDKYQNSSVDQKQCAKLQMTMKYGEWPRNIFDLQDRKPDATSVSDEAARVKVASYMSIYVISRRCAENDVSFTSEQTEAMAQSMKKLFASVDQSIKDDIWKKANTTLPMLSITERDCREAYSTAQYMFPPEVFTSGTPKNPC